MYVNLAVGYRSRLDIKMQWLLFVQLDIAADWMSKCSASSLAVGYRSRLDVEMQCFFL
jgi:hypothetical protein